MKMDYDKWKALSREMTIKIIAQDLIEIYVPANEAEMRARKIVDEGKDQAMLSVKHRMDWALIVLEKLGYSVVLEKIEE